jgi:glycosyl transferase family 2
MFFSVIVPVYNRETLIRRCLASVFSQDFADFEIVAVDDGSTDSSLAVLRAATDPRLRVTPEAIHALWFRCRMDDGRISPDPLPSADEWDYRGYIEFLAETRGRWRDMIRSVRRRCFDVVRYPEDRMLEDKFHLDFARQFRSRLHPDVLRLYHQDAENSLVRYLKALDPLADPAFLHDRANGFSALLRDHGPALRQISRALYGDYLQMAARSDLLAGRRKRALCTSLKLLVSQPFRPAGRKLVAGSLLGAGLALRWRQALSQA